MMADNISIFKNRLDKFWSSYDFVYLFRAVPVKNRTPLVYGNHFSSGEGGGIQTAQIRAVYWSDVP